MAITEIGNSIQIRILFEDGERIKKLKLKPDEPWNEVIHRILDNLESKK